MKDLLSELKNETGLRDLDIRRIMRNASNRYKIYRIPKRSGGTREIAQPAREVKFVQRALIRVLLSKMPIHDCATAYRTNTSILDNARPHAANGPILKMDLKEFFPSIKSRDWVAYCREGAWLEDEEDILLTSHLLFYKRKGDRNLSLAIGAPSSPILSNILMLQFDRAVVSAVGGDRVTYTRYADDLTFSAPRTGYLTGVMTAVAREIRSLRFPKLSINGSKTTYVTKKYHRTVTGLTLANDGRVTIGRESKRKTFATVHHAVLGKLSAEETQVLAGTLAYINSAEPAFLDTLRTKYGAEAILRIQRTVILGHKPGEHSPPLAAK